MLKNNYLLVFIGFVSLIGCARKGMIVPETQLIAGNKEIAPVPLGVERFCWEEPLVQFEQNGPGLDVDGNWYHPSYVAVREVRQGRWRPCNVVPNEIKGDLRNER